MPSVLEMLQSQLGSGLTDQLSRQLGADKSATGAAISAALPLLIGALARNASSEEGSAALHGALQRDHDGSILDALGGFLGRAEEGPGAAILKHVLGSRQGRVERGLSQTTGLNAAQVARVLTTLAPVVLGALGKMQRQGNLAPKDLGAMLGQERQAIESRAPAEMGLLGALLDADGDGDVDLSDLAKKGLGGLGGLFGR